MFSQNISLKVKGNNAIETKTIDSLNYDKIHVDYKSITLEVDSIQSALFKMGYIENKLNEIYKTSDSLFTAQIHLKKKYNSNIYILQ